MLDSVSESNEATCLCKLCGLFCNEIIWGFGGPEEDHQLHHCCWTGRVGEREEEEDLT